MTVTVRFAPSPTGKLHVGNLRTALVNWLFARNAGGRFILRIDDTDLERSSKAYEAAIKTDLHWLGLDWDETFNQSDRFAAYDAAVDRLKASGHLYPCYETAEELDRKRKLQRLQNQPPVYDRAALALTADDRARLEAEGQMPHWRFKLSGQVVRWDDVVRGDSVVDTASVSDPVLIRADGAYLYTLSSVVDDIDSAVTHIIRGEDHVTNTGAQVELFRALGAEPPAFAHMPLLVDADGQGLSKRLGSLSIESLRDEGLEPLALLSVLARLGTPDPVAAASSLTALAGSYQLGKMSRAPARFDPNDLWAVNAQILQQMDYAAAQPRLAALGSDLGADFWLAVRGNMRAMADAQTWVQVVRGPITPVIEDAAFIATAARLLPEGALTADSWKQWTAAVAAETGAKGKALFMPLRLALTGQAHGPDMAALLALMGRDQVLARLG